ncbi:hypothetical protein D3C76_1107810 [compost metagenome]
MVKVVLDRTLSLARNNDNIFNTRVDRFFYDVLNRRFVDNREHLFRHCLRCWQESCTYPGSWNNSLPYSLHRLSPSTPNFFIVFIDVPIMLDTKPRSGAFRGK